MLIFLILSSARSYGEGEDLSLEAEIAKVGKEISRLYAKMQKTKIKDDYEGIRQTVLKHLKKANRLKEQLAKLQIEEERLRQLQELVQKEQVQTQEAVSVKAQTQEAKSLSPQEEPVQQVLTPEAVSPEQVQILETLVKTQVPTQEILPLAQKQETQEKKKGRFMLQGGLGGGVFMTGIHYLLSQNNYFDLSTGVGYAIGNAYNIKKAEVTAGLKFGNRIIGAELTYANYSEDVIQVPGLSGVYIKRGGGVGSGIFVSMPLWGLQARIGYNTTLGIVFDAGFSL